MQSRHVLPLSILGGSFLLAAAIYLSGRQQRDVDMGSESPPVAAQSGRPVASDARPEVAPWRRESDEPRAESSAESERTQPAEPASAGPSGADERPVPTEPKTSLQTDAVKAFDAKRSEIVRECWDGSAEGPAAVKLRLSLAFDPDGNVIGSGLHEVGPTKKGVAACVGRRLPSLTIEPIEKHQSVQVEVVVP